MADPASADPTVAGNRYFRVTDQDHRGVILVVSIICASFIPMILALRGTFTSKTLPLDERLAIVVSVCITGCITRAVCSILTSSQAVGLVEIVLIWVAVSQGLGRAYIDVGSSDASSMGRVSLIHSLCFCFCLWR